MKFSAEQHLLAFKKPAKTSRGAYTEKTVWVLSIESNGNLFSAEVAPLVDLSTDGLVDFSKTIEPFLGEVSSVETLKQLKEDMNDYPSLRFGLDSLIRKVSSNDSIWVNSPFSRDYTGIPINGLVWMNDIEHMEQEAIEKVKSGFDCIKFKVGAHDFDSECRMLERFRKYCGDSIQIRLDANGAFHPQEALGQLRDLNRFHIHSIEQPIAVNQWEDTARLCRESPISIALDEELIGYPIENASYLLKELRPQFLILKPTLIGGFDRCDTWIMQARENNTEWWSTSALEGNIGLFDIALWVSQYNPTIPQGLGTGSLFVKNFSPNTRVENGYLYRQ